MNESVKFVLNHTFLKSFYSWWRYFMYHVWSASQSMINIVELWSDTLIIQWTGCPAHFNIGCHNALYWLMNLDICGIESYVENQWAPNFDWKVENLCQLHSFWKSDLMSWLGLAPWSTYYGFQLHHISGWFYQLWVLHFKLCNMQGSVVVMSVYNYGINHSNFIIIKPALHLQCSLGAMIPLE